VEQPILNASAAVLFVTEFRVERYTPSHLLGMKPRLRPTALTFDGNANAEPTIAVGGDPFTMSFGVPCNVTSAEVILYQVGFVVHPLHMCQRMVYLDATGFVVGRPRRKLIVTPPPNDNVAPPGNYMLFVVAHKIPSYKQMVMIS
jgi:hypothetical protein